MEHADRFLRRFYIEKGMFGSLSLTFIFYRPPLAPYSTPEEEPSVKSASGPARQVGEADKRARDRGGRESPPGGGS